MKKQVNKLEKNFDKFFAVYYILFGVMLLTTLVNVANGCFIFKVTELVMGVTFMVTMFAPVLLYGLLYWVYENQKKQIQTGNIVG